MGRERAGRARRQHNNDGKHLHGLDHVVGAVLNPLQELIHLILTKYNLCHRYEFYLHSTDGQTEKQNLVNLPKVRVSDRTRRDPGNVARVTILALGLDISLVKLCYSSQTPSPHENLGLASLTWQRLNNQFIACMMIIQVWNLGLYLFSGQ